MAHLFDGYDIIKAEDIVLRNIGPNRNNISSDLTSLLNVLHPIVFLTKNQSVDSPIHPDSLKKIESKHGIIELMEVLGYERTRQNDLKYFYHSNPAVIETRRKAAEELKRFTDTLKVLKNKKMHELIEFISMRSSERPSIIDRFDHPSRSQHASPQRTTHDHDDRLNRRSVSLLSLNQTKKINSSEIRYGNERTNRVIEQLKEQVAQGSRYGSVSSGFIRRRLARLLFRQIKQEHDALDDESVDEKLQDYLVQLKRNDSVKPPALDEVYFECLIRTHFDVSKAMIFLRDQRPNLKPASTAVNPSVPTISTNLQEIFSPLHQKSFQLNEYRGDDGATQMLLHAEDEWKNCAHVLPAIRRLRADFQDEILVSRIHRLLLSEFSLIIGRQSELKINWLSYALKEVTDATFENIDMSDIKDIMRSCRDDAIDEQFYERVQNHLRQECPICAEILPRSRMETMFLCSDSCCINCAKDYYRGAIKHARDASTLHLLTCYQTHPIPTDSEERLNFFNHLEGKFVHWFRDERLLMEVYHENIFIATNSPDVIKCGNPKCRASFVANQNRRRMSVRCVHCQYQQCLQCSRKWFDDHQNMECEAYAEWLADNDPDDPDVQLTNYLRTAGMMCPNPECQQIFEYRAGGCEHFTCSRCRTEFCRICSALFFNPTHGTVCQRETCNLKNTVHAHCFYNCYREIRDAEVDDIINLLTANNIDYAAELQTKPVATGVVCPVDGCNNPPSAERENRFCETCFKQFICLLVWRHQIEPWPLYSENQLTVRLRRAGVEVEDGTDKDDLIELCQTNLAEYLGKPTRISRMKLGK